MAFANVPSPENNSSNLAIVSSAVTLAPAWKPNKALTPLSLNRSAAPIPPEKALWIWLDVVSKSNPVTAATLPVISNTLFKSSASLATTARFPDALDISSSENGTLAANFVRLSKAIAPSSTDPNKNLNLT